MLSYYVQQQTTAWLSSMATATDAPFHLHARC